MARFNFRQGIARRQEDGFGNAANLQPTNGGSYIDLIVSLDPTVFIVAHYDVDYMFTESINISKAWGPFVSGVDYWLYWDVDLVSGELSRGFTTVQPVVGPTAPTSPAIDQHWFKTSPADETVMKVWTGSAWIDKVRLLAAKYQQGANIIHYPIGSQVGISGVSVYAGAILYDPDGAPLQKFTRTRVGQFITTETPLHSQFARIANFRLETAIVQGEAQEYIPIHYAVAYSDFNKLILARNTEPDYPAIGIASEDMIPNEVRTYITKGFISDELNWDWSGYPAGTPLFVGPTGQLVAQPPTSGSIQQIARVIDKITVYVDIQQIIQFGSIKNIVPLQLEKNTGKLIAKDITLVGDCGPRPVGASCLWGYVHDESVPSDTWTVEHNLGSNDINVQIYDENGIQILPNEVIVLDINTIIIDFNVPQSGTANLTALF
jgi:hypothetical protein